MFGANFTENQSVKKPDFVVIFEGKYCQISNGFAPIRLTFLTCFQQRSSFALSTTIRSRNEPMAKPLTSWLVLSFSQHNLRLVVSWRYLHVSVTKYQDKFASLRQVNSPNSWDKFQICCADMYLIRFPLNFAVFRVFLWISRLRSCSKYQKPCTYELSASFTFYKLATKNLRLATIFLRLVAKRRPEDFFNFEP